MNINDYADRFDIDKALGRFCGDKELLSEAIAIYKEDAQKHLESIGELLQAGELEKASTHVHTLKGESGAVGAEAAQLASHKLEKCIKNSDIENSHKLFQKVIEETTIAIQILPDVIE